MVPIDLPVLGNLSCRLLADSFDGICSRESLLPLDGQCYLSRLAEHHQIISAAPHVAPPGMRTPYGTLRGQAGDGGRWPSLSDCCVRACQVL